MRCSNPHCEAETGGPQEDPKKSVNVGVAAHITSASPGGPRFDSELTPEERSGINNAIWLCQNCAKFIDSDVDAHPEHVLRLWRTLAEAEARAYLGKPRPRPHQSPEQRKAAEISKSKDTYVMHVVKYTGRQRMMIGERGGSTRVKLVDCNEFSARIKGDGWESSRSIPMADIEIGYDERFNCLELQEVIR